eukprot:Gregarina_sp_Poly_1__5513@NODE_290_length_9967_cov_88_266061_g251_i0_p3_GENE_NODE_290_length_9967_cov_88_266061_g251_i0NODE_290_length_9967_cov_88_266061_g251_i0_p3_ORF_typecomplete_len270_score22_82EI24/PF07264_11/0_00022_NODE_290_length_9967_cov_88_266061_g251_i07371546
MNAFFLLVQAVFYCIKYERELIRPNLAYFAGFLLIHLLISRPIIAALVQWERVLIDDFVYASFSSWKSSDTMIRFLRWSQAKWMTFVLARGLRRKWRRNFKQTLVAVEGLETQGLSLTYKKPPKDHAGHNPIVYYFSLGWFSTLSSPWLIRLSLLLLSTPIHAIPYLGTWIYMYLHGGIKARRICAEYSRTQGHWDRLRRNRFCADTAKRLRMHACLVEFIEDSPLGCVAMPILDMSVILWMCHTKMLEQVRTLSVEKIESRPGMSSLR